MRASRSLGDACFSTAGLLVCKGCGYTCGRLPWRFRSALGWRLKRYLRFKAKRELSEAPSRSLGLSQMRLRRTRWELVVVEV